MPRIILAALLLIPITAGATEPSTLILPTPIVSAIADYLAQRPYAEVAQMISVLRSCVTAQIPNADGAVVNRGDCPAVSAALAPKEDRPSAATDPNVGKKN